MKLVKILLSALPTLGSCVESESSCIVGIAWSFLFVAGKYEGVIGTLVRPACL